MGWESPWGVGFPGWHIECSAMAIRVWIRRLWIFTPAELMPFNSQYQRNRPIGGGYRSEIREIIGFIIISLHVDGNKMSKSTGNILRWGCRKERFWSAGFAPICICRPLPSRMNFTWSSLGAAQVASNAWSMKWPNYASQRRSSRIWRKVLGGDNDDLNMPKLFP